MSTSKLLCALVLSVTINSAKAGEVGIASVDAGIPTPFDCCNFHGKVATGEKFSPNVLAAAHRTLPLGTIVRVRNILSNESVHVRIWDRGPCASAYCGKVKPELRKRIIDLTPGAADAIHLRGLGKVEVTVCKKTNGIRICS